MKRGPKIIYLRRKVLAAIGCLAAAANLLCAEGLQGAFHQLRRCMG